MTISETLENAINEQIGIELHSSHSYLSMAAYFESQAFDGFANWMHVQSREERDHAMKFYAFLLDRSGAVRLPAIAEPARDFGSLVSVFEASLAQEQAVTKGIYAIYKLAQDEADYATVAFLKWFVDEQVEEEKNAQDMIDKLKLAGDNPEALLALDRLAASRVVEDPEE